jgi:hypothetical protein
MSSRLAILAGLLCGILVAAAVLGGIFVLAPETAGRPPTPSPVPSPSPTAPASSAAPSVGPSGSPDAFWIDADGIVRDGALGGIGPGIMARGLQSILPGVTVTP